MSRAYGLYSPFLTSPHGWLIVKKTYPPISASLKLCIKICDTNLPMRDRKLRDCKRLVTRPAPVQWSGQYEAGSCRYSVHVAVHNSTVHEGQNAEHTHKLGWQILEIQELLLSKMLFTSGRLNQWEQKLLDGKCSNIEHIAVHNSTVR